MKFKIFNSVKDKENAKEHLIRIKKGWNNQEKEILDQINKKTTIKISSNEIICFINTLDTNGYYGEDYITLGIIDKNTEKDIMVIAHELFHIFYWKKLKEQGLFKEEIGKERKVEWELSEVTVYLLQKDLQFLWPNIEIRLYPETKELYEKVKDIWKNNSFEDYLIKSYEIINKTD